MEGPHPTYLKQCHTYLTWEQPVKQGSHIFRKTNPNHLSSNFMYRIGLVVGLSYGYPWGVRTAPSIA